MAHCFNLPVVTSHCYCYFCMDSLLSCLSVVRSELGGGGVIFGIRGTF